MTRNAGKVMRLKMPRTPMKASPMHALAIVLSLFSRILRMSTIHHNTSSVSIEFENVCVWKVQVT